MHICFPDVSIVNQHSSTDTSKRFTIPEPTWSISSLGLHESHTPASIKELQILAKRAVLNLRRIDDESKQQLCQDLGNMLHMMKQVQNFQSTNTSTTATTIPNDENDSRMMYDLPRGVTETPFRIDDSSTRTAKNSIEQQHQQNEEVRMSQSVRESYLEPKMKRVGGHQYFEIITSIQTNK